MSKSKRKFACNTLFLFCKDGAICAKNSPKRTSHGVARAIVKGTSLRSLSPIMAPATDQFYITTLVLTREIFPVKQKKHVAIAKTYTSMKARDVKNENQMKLSFFRGNLSPRKDKGSNFIPL